MRATLVVARGPTVYLVSGGTRIHEFPLGPTPSRGHGASRTTDSLGVPGALVEELRAVDPSVPVVVCGRSLFGAVAGQLVRPPRLAGPAAWHFALGALPPLDPKVERERFLLRARADLDAALRSPEEVLVSLAREEERLERSVGREQRAAEAFVAVPGTVLEEYARGWERARETLEQHHRELVRLLEGEAQRTLPNLSAVVGARTAGRLAAAAGGFAPLARMSSSRLQLLGSRRRPGPERGPRYGVIYRAEDAEQVPGDRRGAFARSEAALAAIAARADILTHRNVAEQLVRRRTTRRDQLRRRRR